MQIKTLDTASGEVEIPPSKSLTHRFLIIAALAPGLSHVRNPLDAEDTILTKDGLKMMGATFEVEGRDLLIRGTGGRFSAPKREIFLGNSGTSLRLLIPVSALGEGEFVFTGTERLKQRPVGPLLDALSALGAECSSNGGFPPAFIRARGLRGGRAKIDASLSSQFVSGLLLAAPLAEQEVQIEVVSLASAPYVDLTVEAMREAGVEVGRDGEVFVVGHGQAYRAGEYLVEGDASSASYFWAAAAITRGRVRTLGINPASIQGDMGLLDLLVRMGCRVTRGDDWVEVEGGSLRGIDADMNGMPDMVPTLAVVASFAGGKTRITNVAHLRIKESDRLAAVAGNLSKMGARVEELADGLVIEGRGPLSGATINTHNDHRIAMAFAVAGLRVPGVRVDNPLCVEKSFPAFWDSLRLLYGGDK